MGNGKIPELDRIYEMVDEFVKEMKHKFHQKFFVNNYRGWDDLGQKEHPDTYCKGSMMQNIADEDWIDVANLACILRWRERSK